MPWGPWRAQNWSSSPYGWHNILDTRIFGHKGVKFKNKQYFKKLIYGRVWKWVRIYYKWIGKSKYMSWSPRVELIYLFFWVTKYLRCKDIGSKGGSNWENHQYSKNCTILGNKFRKLSKCYTIGYEWVKKCHGIPD